MDDPRPLIFRTLVVLALVGLAFTIARFVLGIGAIANVNNAYPWGWWVGFGVLGFIGFGGAGFTIALLVYIFGQERFRPFVRPAITLGLLLYIRYFIVLLIELGRPWASPVIFISWQPTSALFEIAWCAALYTSVLVIEFGKLVATENGWGRLSRILAAIYLPAVVIGVSLSHLHQSSLGTLMTIVPLKVEPLWWSELLPATFLLTSYMAGMCVVTIEHVLATAHLRLVPRVDLLAGLARIQIWVITLFLVLRLGDLAYRDALGGMLRLDSLSLLMWAEVVLGFLLPLALFATPDLRRSKWALFATSCLLAGGVLMNRLNTAVFGMHVKHWETYTPSLGEVMTTLGALAAAALVYGWLLRVLPIHSEEPLPASESVRESDVVPAVAMRPAESVS